MLVALVIAAAFASWLAPSDPLMPNIFAGRRPPLSEAKGMTGAMQFLVLGTLEIALLILAEAGLSFLGFGLQPPEPSWGLMIARGREYLREAWWMITFPGLAIFLTTRSLNLLANWVRTITDPVQRWRWLI